MRRLSAVLVVMVASVLVLAQAQQAPRRRTTPPSVRAHAAELPVKQAAEQLAAEKKVIERDLQVLAHLRDADAALADPMQPSVAVEKAHEHIQKAESLNTDFLVQQGLIRTRQEIDSARRSPASADFGRLRSILREHALGPSSRLAVRNAARLHEETIAWMAVQEQISAHLRALTNITGESLRASQQE